VLGLGIFWLIRAK